MAADQNPCTSRGTDLPRKAVKRARIVLVCIAFAELGLLLLCLPILVLARGPEGAARLLKAALESCLRLPLLFLVPCVAFQALLSAEIMVESIRFGSRATRSWSDTRHVITVLLTWMALLLGQLSFTLAARHQLLER